MAITPIKQGQKTVGWRVDIQPGGRGSKRFRKKFKNKVDALSWERKVQSKVQEQPEWTPTKRDARRLSDLNDLWHEHHGIGLRTKDDRYARLQAMTAAMGNPRAEKFTAEMFVQYRSKRIEAGLSKTTANLELSYLRAVFNELNRLGQWKRENPLSKVRKFKIQETEMKFLAQGELKQLMQSLDEAKNPHVKLIAKICLSTGCRWGEAEELRISQVAGDGLIKFARTKTDKARAVQISKELELEIQEHYNKQVEMRKEEMIAVNRENQIFNTAYSAFREAIKRAGIKLPKGQSSHVLRHTFASHFMMTGRSIITLQRILGHSSLAMTMRYAHHDPEHLSEAKTSNPLALFDLG